MLTATGPNASGASTTWTYGWDGASNRISYKVGAGTPVTTTCSGAGHPVSADDGTTFSTDAVGNLTKIDPPGTTSDRAYAYDAYSRMTCAKVGTACTGTGQVSYTLDALDRVLTRVGTATKTFTYSGASETIAKTVEGTNTYLYIHTLGGGSPLAQKKGSAIRWYLRDTHGDVVGLITPTGGNQGTVAFDPWGLKLGVTGTETSAFGFQGDPPPLDSRSSDTCGE